MSVLLVHQQPHFCQHENHYLELQYGLPEEGRLILTHKPDIVIIPECEHPDKLKFTTGTPEPADTLWFGTNPNKGLGIFSYSKFRFQLHETHNPELRMIIPVSVTDGTIDFMLYAI